MSTQIILRLLITLLILDTSSARPLWAWLYYDDYTLQEYPLDDDTPYDDTYQIQKRTESNNGGFQLLDLIITELKSHMTC